MGAFPIDPGMGGGTGYYDPSTGQVIDMGGVTSTGGGTFGTGDSTGLGASQLPPAASGGWLQTLTQDLGGLVSAGTSAYNTVTGGNSPPQYSTGAPYGGAPGAYQPPAQYTPPASSGISSTMLIWLAAGAVVLLVLMRKGV